MVACEEAPLQLANPVPAGGDRQARIAFEVLLEPSFVELRIVERDEIRRYPPQRPDEHQLSGEDVGDETELHLSCKGQRALGFPLHVAERLAIGEQQRDETVAGIGCISEVAGLLGDVEGASHQLDPAPQMPRPGIDEVPEAHVSLRLEAKKITLLHEIEGELAEAEPGLVVAEARTEDHAEPQVAEA